MIFKTTPEKKWLAIFAILVVMVTTLPYLLGYSLQGADWHFSGFVFGVEDGNSYIAKMLSGMAGAWLFRTPYTAFPQQGALMFLPYLLLGKLAAPPGSHEQLVVLYHLFRVVAGFLEILATYQFLAFFIPEQRQRCWGVALVILGGGLGWILVLLGLNTLAGSLPLDYYSPETFGFLGLFGIPHLALARALVLWTLLSYLRECRRGGPSRQVKTGILWLLSGLAQPLAPVVVGAVVGFHLLALAAWQWLRIWRGEIADWTRWRKLLGYAVMSGILPGIFLLYNLWSVQRDLFLKSWSAQNIIRSPNPLHYLLAYGMLLPFVILGAARLIREDPWKGWLPAAWVLGLPFLAYAPVNLQRRLPDGVWVAIIILAIFSSEGWKARKLKILNLRIFNFRHIILIALLSFPTTLFILLGGFLSASRLTKPVFRPAGEVAVFEFLAQKAGKGAVILAAYDTSNAMPAWAPVRVLAGHGPESVHLSEMDARVAYFFSGEATDAERVELVRQFNVQYIFWGPAEKALGKWDPRQAGFRCSLPALTQLYQSGDFMLFEVNQ